MTNPEVLMNSTVHLIVLTCLLGGLGLAVTPMIDKPEAVEPFTFSADFESGSVGAWSSYPPAQDTAYDPSIWVKKIEGNAGLCLVREITPYTTDAHEFGVRKKTRIYLDGDSRLAFRYYIKSYAGAGELVIKLGFADGTSRELPVPVARLMKWGEADIPLSALLNGDKVKLLEAVAIVADCPQADPETKLRLAIDDLKITGLRPKGIAVDSPAVHELEELGVAVARDHLDMHADLRISGRFPVTIKSASIALTRFWQDSRPPARKALKLQGLSWASTLMGRDLGPGLWRAVISGKTAAGATLEKTIFFLVDDPNKNPEHPYLLATAADLERIRQAARSGHARDVWDEVRREAATYREKFDPSLFRYNLDAYDEVFWLPTYEGYVRALHTPSRFIRENSIVYAVSGDREAGEAARQALLRIAEWPSFVHPHILNQGQFTYWPVGLALIDFAIGYDFVYDLLSPEERRTVARALYTKGVTEVFKEYVRDNRVSSNTSNWISHVTGGGLLCALAIRREYPPAELEPYLTGMIVKLGGFIADTFDPDGYYGEGYYYHNFAMQSLSHTLPALEKSFDIAPPAEVMNSFQYLLYQQDTATGRIYEFGDAHDDLIPSSMSNFAYVLARDGNPRLRWLYEQRPGDNYLDLLFAPPAGTAEPPESLPLTKRLRMVGSTIFRSGFGHDDFVFVFKCGPFFNHQHFDQGSFFLADRGEAFVEECGNSNYYEDPWYPRLYMQAGGHNCLLSDGDVESQRAGDFRHDVSGWRDFARTTDFLDTGEATFLSADLTPVYKNKWRSLRRNILYLKPRTIVIIDRGEGAADVENLSVRFHAPRKENIRLDGRSASIVRGRQALAIRTVYPETVEARVVKRPLSLNEFKAENPITMKARGFLELETDVRNGAAGFIHVLSTDSQIMQALKCTDRSTCLELSIAGSSYFLSKGAGTAYEASGVRTDALVFHRNPNGFMAARMTRVEEDDHVMIKSDKCGSFGLARNGNRLSVSFSTPEGAHLEVYSSRKPRAVSSSGGRPVKWEYRAANVRLTLPAGEGTIDISL
jgi:hypothetical protein